MAPGDRPIPGSLRAGGHGTPRPRIDTSDYSGRPYQQSPASPRDGNPAYWNAPSPRSPSNGADGTRSSEDRIGRRTEDIGRGSSRDHSSPRDHPPHHDWHGNHRDRSRPSGRPHTKSPGSSARVCKKCGESLTGQFVRALGATFHLECFKCEVSSPMPVFSILGAGF